MSDRIDKIVNELYQVPKFTSKNSPAHTRAFLEELGNPQEDFSVIHVAGSNGKGSVCAFFGEMFAETGAHVGMFISPHLADIRERFLIDGELCSEKAFLDAYETARQSIRHLTNRGLPHPTFFEILFAVGMLIFSRERVDIAVLETGLGGRLDATNIVRHPLLTVITSISLEHTQYLGDTIAAIAGEKAGILKPGVPVVYDASEPEAAAVIEARAAELCCPAVGVRQAEPACLTVEGRKKELCCSAVEDRKTEQDCQESCGQRTGKGDRRWSILNFHRKSIDFSLFPAYDSKTDWNIPFVSEYQVQNAALAITGMQLLRRQSRRAVPADESLQAALTRTKWPGRMEEILPDVYLDGAHNEAGIRAFTKTVCRICRAAGEPGDKEKSGSREKEDSSCCLNGEDGQKPVLLFSMVRDKDYKTAVRILAEEVDWSCIILTSIQDERGLSTDELDGAFRTVLLAGSSGKGSVLKSEEQGDSAGSAKICRIKKIEDVKEAFDYAMKQKKETQKIFACGSLYFIGELKNLKQVKEAKNAEIDDKKR